MALITLPAAKLLVTIVPAVIEGVRLMYDFFKDHKKEEKAIANEESFDKSQANVEDIEKINTLLGTLKNAITADANRLEDELRLVSGDFNNKIIDMLHDMDVNSRSFEQINFKNERRIKNVFASEIGSKMSLGNSRCLEILHMSAGESKENAISKFKNEILVSALSSIKTEICENLQGGLDMMNSTLSNKLEMEDMRINSNVKNLKLLADSTDIAQKEEVNAKLQSSICATDIMLDKLDEIK